MLSASADLMKSSGTSGQSGPGDRLEPNGTSGKCGIGDGMESCRTLGDTLESCATLGQCGSGDNLDSSGTWGYSLNSSGTLGDSLESSGTSGYTLDSSGTLGYSLDSSGTLGYSLDSSGTLGDSLETSGTLGDNLESGGTLRDSLESSSTLGDSLESSSTLGDSLESSSTLGDSLESSSTLGDSLDPSRTLGDSLDSNGTLGDSVESSGTLGDSLDSNGTLGDSVESSGTLGDSVESSATLGDSVESSGMGGRTLRVCVGGRVFTVLKREVAWHCEFFRALFRSGMRECRQEQVWLHCVGVGGFLVLLRVLGGERPALSSQQIADAIECTAFLQAPPLTRHLGSLLSSDNCLLVFQQAAAFGVWDLAHRAAGLIRDMHADLRDHVHALPPHLRDYVRSLLPSRYVAVCSHSPSSERVQDMQRTVCYLDEDGGAGGDWQVLTHLPAATSTIMAGVAVHRNKLYIVGGVRDVRKTVVGVGFCYDPALDSWSTIRGPQQLRYNLTLLGHEGSLYAMGGECDRTALSSVERYSLADGSWGWVSSLPSPAASVVSALAMNRIFVCLWRGEGATDIHEYEAERDRWMLVTSLVRQHSYGLHMVGHRDNLYLIRNRPPHDFLVCVMDRYNLTSGQWTAVSGHYGNSKGSLLTAVVRGDSVFTLSRHETTEYTVQDAGWRARRHMRGFGRIGSIYTALMRLPPPHRRFKGSGWDSVTRHPQILSSLPP